MSALSSLSLGADLTITTMSNINAEICCLVSSPSNDALKVHLRLQMSILIVVLTLI